MRKEMRAMRHRRAGLWCRRDTPRTAQGRRVRAEHAVFPPLDSCLPEKYLSWLKEKYFSSKEFKLE
ncbi:hypothetical protein ACQ4WQ_04205 [Janthinobacterium sp. GB1R12]|uniref:hypothetical protein n=1 Tax=Janthinobacterium sp. GB1R12 TaxID=3424190 RepID=UPI003F2042D5